MPQEQTDGVTALYIRVSTDAQAEEGYSIPAQREKLLSLCELRDYNTREEYIDGGFSGSNLARPAMEKLIADCEAGNIARVVVYKLDRLSRSQKDTLYLIEDVFLPRGVDFISLGENIDTTTPYGRAMIGILSAFAQLERENIFMRTRMGMAERVKDGYWPGGGRKPFGYDYDKEAGILVPNADAVKVKKMAELYLEGWSPRRIAALFGMSHDRIVTQILKRKTNVGKIVYNGIETQGRHMPILSEELYDRVIAQMKARERTRVDRKGHLLSGLCWCGVCGARVRYQQWGPKGMKLVCYSRDKAKPHMMMDPNCDNPPVWAAGIEEIVRDDLFAVSSKLTDVAAPFDPRELLRGEIARIETKIKRLYNLYAEQGDVLLLETIRENEARRAAAEAEIAVAEEQTVKLARRDAMIRVRDVWDHLTPKERQTLVRECVERVVINKDGAEVYYAI